MFEVFEEFVVSKLYESGLGKKKKIVCGLRSCVFKELQQGLEC